MTCNRMIGEDATAVFNMLSSEPESWNQLAVAPLWLRGKFLSWIKRETEFAKSGRPAYIIAKMNSLCDKGIIAALYEASAAGVKIDLIIRGICCVKAGIPGVSENIRVRSIVGTFLEHSRIFCFGNGGNEEIYMGSADWMPRNLDRRVEITFPVLDPSVRAKVRHILEVELEDTVRARIMKMDESGQYERIDKRGKEIVDSQDVFCKEAEAEAVRRVLYLAKLAGDAPVYIVHLSCKESLEAVEEARRNGQKNIFVETCTQYLTLTEDRYKDPDGLKYIMSPPLRTQQDLDALWKGLEAGEIQIVATDHCPFNYAKEKQDGKDDFRKCPNGAPGVEERMILLFSEGVMKNKISINKLVEVACTNPAKVYGMYPKKGIIEPGADGDLVIIDADAKQTLTHKMMHGAVDYTSYEGTDLHGKIDLVMQRGNIIAENNEFKGNRGDGKYLYRKPFLGDL